ncbi:GntP family permease [Croceicoccus ponticola]|uniref:GntP family permease n=1 Tax=Croceicoccus ponticola TaxID=2217664 RepID=A0A437GYX0_9SPHN|nr:GntP family permease [Croceicoccus ponticola]RVQ66936.1 GntP family permease [Croceicoccus ponticola]
MLSWIGLIGGLALLIWMTVRGINILIAGPVAALVVALTAGLPLLPPLAAMLPDGTAAPDFATSYMAGFSSFLADWFLMFLLGAIFGEVMAASGAAASVARFITQKLGSKYALAATVLACAVLTYGGVSVFIVAFSVYGLAVELFREANLPRRFIPGALAFGSVTFTMTSAGSPEIQNLIPMPYLGTTAYAAWEVSMVVALFMATLGYIFISRMVKNAVLAGEGFDTRESDERFEIDTTLPSPLLAISPLAGVLGVFLVSQSLGKWALVLALGSGVALACMVGWSERGRFAATFSRGATGAVVAITNTCAVVGFGSVAKLSPAFMQALDAVQAIPGSPLIGAAIAVTVIAGLTGSASGGQTIALPLIAPHYLDAGADPQELHRIVAIASGALDSLPHNGYVVTTIRAVCGETHQAAYKAVAATTVVVPALGTILALVLFSIF